MSIYWISWLFLLCLLGLALAYDITQRRIPNWLVLAGLVAGVGCSLLVQPAPGALTLPAGVSGPEQALLGALAGLAIMAPLYFLRAMGAGDAKLMAAVGAFLGPIPILGTALLTFVVGGVLSLVVALASGSLRRVLGNLRLISLVAVYGRNSGISLRDVPTTGRLPYALAIAAGTGLQLWLAGQKGWPFP
ncbi:MAG: prepilin peptidase [Bacteroidota bacterium]